MHGLVLICIDARNLAEERIVWTFAVYRAARGRAVKRIAIYRTLSCGRGQEGGRDEKGGEKEQENELLDLATRLPPCRLAESTNGTLVIQSIMA